MSKASEAWKTMSFDGSQVVEYLHECTGMLTEMGVDITDTKQLKAGLERLFHVTYENMPDMGARGYILAPNHISDFDALLLGLVYENILIMSKNEWVENEALMRFMSLHYALVGVNRESSMSQARALVKLVRHLGGAPQPQHALVFPQGTISDIRHNSVERVHAGVFVLSHRTGVPVLPVFIEQPSLQHPTRIVFGAPMDIPGREEDCRAQWRDALIALADGLTPAARTPVLTEKHANNNKPGDPFF